MRGCGEKTIPFLVLREIKAFENGGRRGVCAWYNATKNADGFGNGNRTKLVVGVDDTTSLKSLYLV